jgi:hypothetical protein
MENFYHSLDSCIWWIHTLVRWCHEGPPLPGSPAVCVHDHRETHKVYLKTSGEQRSGYFSISKKWFPWSTDVTGNFVQQFGKVTSNLSPDGTIFGTLYSTDFPGLLFLQLTFRGYFFFN